MKVIFKGRGNGKTFDLINRAAEIGAILIVANERRKINTKRMAEKMGKDVEVMTIHEAVVGGKMTGRRQDLCLDDLDDLIVRMFHIAGVFNNIDTASITIPSPEGFVDDIFTAVEEAHKESKRGDY